jgi:parallel beta-helix repeat protein
LIVYCDSVTVEENRLVTSPDGSGLKIDQCKEVLVSKNEIARNAAPGVHISESQNIRLNKNEFEANNKSAIAVDYLFRGSLGVVVSENLIQYNNGYGIESHFPYSLESNLNQFIGNKDKNIGKIK